MIYGDSKPKSAIITKKKDRDFVYWGRRLKWEKAACCYSSGAWRDDLPWKNEYGWKNI